MTLTQHATPSSLAEAKLFQDFNIIILKLIDGARYSWLHMAHCTLGC